MPRPRRHSNTPDQEAARVFEAKLKRHVQENPECKWEYEWFRNSLKKSIRRSRVQIDEQVRKKAESGQPLCDKFMLELAAPFSYLDGAQSPRSSLFASHSPDERAFTSDSSPERDPRAPSLGDVSPERNTPFQLATTPGSDPPTSSSRTTVPGGFIPVAASNAQSPEGKSITSPKFNPRTAIPGTPYDESAVSSVAPTPKVPGAFLASAHSLVPSVEHSPTRPDVIPGPSASDVPEIILVPEPDMDMQTPRFELPSPFDQREIPRVHRSTPHTSSEDDHPMVLDSGDRPDTRVGDHPRAGDVPREAGDVPQEAEDIPVVHGAGDNPSAQEAGNDPQAPGTGPVADDHPIAPVPAREPVPSAPGPYRLPGSYQPSVHSTPGITPGASVENLAVQPPESTLIVEDHPTGEPTLKRPDTPKSDAGLELDLFPHPPALQVPHAPALQVPSVPAPAHSDEMTPRSPISPIVPGAYNRSLFDLASALPTRSLGGAAPDAGVGAPSVGQVPSAIPSGASDLGAEQAPLEPVPAPVLGTEPTPDVDVDQVPPTNLDLNPPESISLPTKDSPAPAPEPVSDHVPTKIPASTLQVYTEPDSSGLTPTPSSVAPSPFALIPGFGGFDIRNWAPGEGEQLGGPVGPESQGDDEPLEPDAAPESNEPTRNPPEGPVVIDGTGEIKLDDEPLENVSPPVVLEPVVPEDTRPEESVKTSAEVDASSGIAASPKNDDVQTPEADATATERAPAASEPSIQDVTAPETLKPESADKSQDEAQAPQVKLEDLPGREPEVDLGAPLKSEDVPSQTQPELEAHAPSEPAPVEQENQGVTTDGQGPVLDEVPPRDAVTTPDPESSPTVQDTVHQPEPAQAPEQTSSETKTEPIAEPEELVPKVDPTPSLDPSRTESQNIPVQQPDPQLELPEAQPTELLSNSEHTPAPSQTVEPRPQETTGDSEHDQPAAPRHDSSPKVPQSNPGLPDSREAAPKIDSAPDVAGEVPVQESTVVPPALESTDTAQETAPQLEPAEEPEQIASIVGSEPLLDVQPSLPAPAPVPSESLPSPPAADSADLGSRPSPQPADAVHIAPDAEPQPSAVQVPVETGSTQEPPSPTPEAHPDLSSTLVGETQQAVADQDGSLAADSSPSGHPDTPPNVELTGPGPVTIEIPGQRAPTTDPEGDDHALATPVSASTAEVESIRTPLDADGPQPRAQSESPTPPDDPQTPLDPTAMKATQLSTEAGKLAQQFGAYGNIDDLDEAIETYGQAAELLAPGSDVLDVSSYLDLGRMMRVKFEAFNDINDLDSAFDDALLKAHDLLRSTPMNKLYHDVLHELGAASLDRYLYNGSEVAGDDTQRYCELAMNAEPSPSGQKRAETCIVLSRLYLARFENLSGAEDAVSALESLDAASLADSALAGQARYMENRARALFACYQTRRPEYTGYLDEALVLARPARDLTPTTTIQHPITSTFLAELLLARYERSHDQPDLDEALELLEDAVQEVPYVCPEQPWVGERLARALLARFANERDAEDLDDAISFLEIALNLTVTNPHRRRARLDAFGGALTLRFRYLALGQELAEDDRRELMAGIGSM